MYILFQYSLFILDKRKRHKEYKSLTTTTTYEVQQLRYITEVEAIDPYNYLSYINGAKCDNCEHRGIVIIHYTAPTIVEAYFINSSIGGISKKQKLDSSLKLIPVHEALGFMVGYVVRRLVIIL